MGRIAVIGLAVSLALASCVSSGSIPAATTEIIKVIATDKTAGEAFDLSILWINANFNSSKSVIQYSDKQSGKIVGKASMASGLGGFGQVNFDLTIESRDNRVRLTANATSFEYDRQRIGINQKIFDQFSFDIDSMSANYERYISSHSSDF